MSEARARLVELRAVLRRAVLSPPLPVVRRVLLRRPAVLREAAPRAVDFRELVLRVAALRVVALRVVALRAEVLRVEVLRVGEARRDDALRVVLVVRRVDPALRAGLFEVLRRDVLLRDDVPLREVVRRVALRTALARLPPERLADAFRFVPDEREEPDRVEVAERLGLREDFAEDLRLGFSGTSTPARRASESPIAIACRAFFAPCLPLRIWSISRCTNSPAWVLADLPARLSRWARRIVSLSGMLPPERDERNPRRAMNVPAHEASTCTLGLRVSRPVPRGNKLRQSGNNFRNNGRG
ncbi:MAG TPA: hypothetical protein VFJ62_08640 [Usitatibacter sp.]|nr:hypothetical protein [Usitatibacter sp.]